MEEKRRKRWEMKREVRGKYRKGEGVVKQRVREENIIEKRRSKGSGGGVRSGIK